ncbi:uncharacterized protein RCC_10824 [Ramularia collo-cygni]|uniref:Uncharacterized protein n=1 Tax=Ramularia collo-cygni TaxID=112498 RepID=A0A2D3VGH8_9PEZI|nr:uncharacterized protein RCC_10824 [Ramularia collo-cygni]CZT25095.1 uncharacterized protein RCC_10824 [Ramularia collo-cygni]
MSEKETSSQGTSKSGKMAALKSMFQKDESAKRAPSVASTSTDAPLLDRNGNKTAKYTTAETMQGQFRFTSG